MPRPPRHPAADHAGHHSNRPYPGIEFLAAVFLFAAVIMFADKLIQLGKKELKLALVKVNDARGLPGLDRLPHVLVQTNEQDADAGDRCLTASGSPRVGNTIPVAPTGGADGPDIVPHHPIFLGAEGGPPHGRPAAVKSMRSSLGGMPVRGEERQRGQRGRADGKALADGDAVEPAEVKGAPHAGHDRQDGQHGAFRIR